MKILGIIPARYSSTRLPGKPLEDINGTSMIMRVYRQAIKCDDLTDVVVATDDQRIFDHVHNNKGKAVITSETHPSGTDRCAEVLDKMHSMEMRYDAVINIQGDEPFIDPRQISKVASLFTDPQVEIATLVKKIETQEDLFNVTLPKVILGNNGRALYFSREAIPHIRGKNKSEWLNNHTYYRHLGIYGYRSVILPSLASLKPSLLEQAEALEQLRWLENGFRIFAGETNLDSISVDTQEDLQRAILHAQTIEA